MQFDTTYRNRTANRTARSVVVHSRPRFVVWHETASPNPDNPIGTLDYNLVNDGIRGSYHALIARSGTVFDYLDASRFIAWHAGKRNRQRNASITLAGTTYRGFDINAWSYGVELDGACDGTPATPAQRNSATALMLWLEQTFAIPLERAYHVMHRELTDAGYRRDPTCVHVDTLLAAAWERKREHQPPSGDYVVNVERANVREGPGTAFPVALDGTAVLPRGTKVTIGSVHAGEHAAGSTWWGHIGNEIGFVAMGLLQRAAP